MLRASGSAAHNFRCRRLEAGPPMSVRVAIRDPLPLFRRGIAAALHDIDIAPDAPDDLLAWTREQRPAIVFLTLESANDWALLDQLSASATDITVLAVLVEATTANYVRALSAGAVACLPRHATPAAVREVLQSVLAGTSAVPIQVLRVLAARHASVGSKTSTLTDEELSWLRELAQGTKVGTLAEQARYSERMMFRHLHEIYRKLGVRTRTEALMYGREQGWL
ncbi:response regulator transcription factor [Dactylosporangium sp. NPDC050688]|uniref:response regulator transcription factor n=1 Tax=Dactylosporangium sp. NPDC050688 TaxID=3157217 RepID=UPI0033E9BE78